MLKILYVLNESQKCKNYKKILNKCISLNESNKHVCNSHLNKLIKNCKKNIYLNIKN